MLQCHCTTPSWSDFTILNILGGMPHVSNTCYKASLGTESYTYMPSANPQRGRTRNPDVLVSSPAVAVPQKSCHNVLSPFWGHSGTFATHIPQSPAVSPGWCTCTHTHIFHGLMVTWCTHVHTHTHTLQATHSVYCDSRAPGSTFGSVWVFGREWVITL